MVFQCDERADNENEMEQAVRSELVARREAYVNEICSKNPSLQSTLRLNQADLQWQLVPLLLPTLDDRTSDDSRSLDDIVFGSFGEYVGGEEGVEDCFHPVMKVS
jgi:hypothetical protein